MNFNNLNNVQKGYLGERIALKYLVSIGMEILYKNYKNKIGEIDIICRLDDYLIFVEVKSRLSSNYGFPCESVDFKKVRKIRSVANYFIAVNKLDYYKVRFDVVEVYFSNKKINHIEDAF